MTRAILLLLAIASSHAEELTFHLPPVKTSITFGNQPITISAQGVITGRPNSLQDIFRLTLIADMGDLQEHIAALLGAELNSEEPCGDRLSVDRATLVPMSPAGLLTAYVHYERWVCVKMLGKQVVRKLVSGDGAIPVTLTPSVQANEIKLDPEVGTIEAKGALGEVLRSPPVRDRLRDKIHDAILSALQKGADLKSALPLAIQRVVIIERAHFEDAGSSRLSLELGADIRMPAAEIRKLLDK